MQDNKVHQTLLMDKLSKFRYDLQISFTLGYKYTSKHSTKQYIKSAEKQEIVP